MCDRQSHSLWAQMEGRAIVGDRAGTRLVSVPGNTLAFEGRRLSAVPHVDAFWFAWAAFNPSTSIHGER